MKATRHSHFLAQVVACAVLAKGFDRDIGRNNLRKMFSDMGGDEEAITALVATYDRYLTNMVGGGALFPKEELPAMVAVLRKHLGDDTDWGLYASVVYTNRLLSHRSNDNQPFHGWFTDWNGSRMDFNVARQMLGI